MSKSIFERATKLAFAQFEAANGSFERLHPAVQTLVRITSAQGIIDNGGLQFFFESDWEGMPPYSAFSDAYRQIGALDSATWLDKAVRLFGFENPHRDAARRQARMELLWADDIGEFADLDYKLMEASDSVWKLLERFAVKHSDTFGISGH